MFNYAKRFVSDLKPHKTQARVVGLKGELGSGKTTFVKGVARALGVVESITSPTFVILKRYNTTSTIFKELFHIDAYRIDRAQELLDLGWEDIYKDTSTLIFIEWPENVRKILPKDAIKLDFTFIDEHTRRIETHDSA